MPLMSPAHARRTAAAPAPLRFSREEYHRVAESGLFEGRRVELLDGEIIEMAPQGSRHASAVAMIVEVLVRRLAPSFSVRPQLPLVLDDLSEPEPDIAVCMRDPGAYSTRHPGPADVVLVIEVADTSLAYDQGRKAAAYARAGLRACWIVDLENRCVEVLSDAGRDEARYREIRRVAEAGSLPLPDGTTIEISELLPPA